MDESKILKMNILFIISLFFINLITKTHQYENVSDLSDTNNTSLFFKQNIYNSEYENYVKSVGLKSNKINYDKYRVSRDIVSVSRPVCDMPECNCHQDLPAPWMTVTCEFNHTQDLILSKGSLPVQVMDLVITGSKTLEMREMALSGLLFFQRLRVINSKEVIFKKNGFVTTMPSLRVEIQDCSSVIINKHALKTSNATVVLEMIDIAEMHILENAFSYLQNATFVDIRRLKLNSGAFEFDSHTPISRHGPSTKMLFQNVLFIEIPKNTFKTSADEVKFVNCNIPTFKQDSFSAVLYHSIVLLNSSIKRIEKGAFSERTQVYNLTISKCRIQAMDSEAVKSAINNLTITKNGITAIATGAINLSAVVKADVSSNIINEFHPRAMAFRSWNTIIINGNTFDKLLGPFSIDMETTGNEISFVGNNIRELEENSLSFIKYSDFKMTIDNNHFERLCKCDLPNWLIEKFGRNDSSIEMFQKTSYCTVKTEEFAHCYNVTEGNVQMAEFYDKMSCQNDKNITCIGRVTAESVTKVYTEIENPYFPKRNLTGMDSKGSNNALVYIIGGAGVLVLVVIVLAVVYCYMGDRCLSNGLQTSTSITSFHGPVDPPGDCQPLQEINNDSPAGQERILLTLKQLNDLRIKKDSPDPAISEPARRDIIEIYERVFRFMNKNNNESVCSPEVNNTYESVDDVRSRLVPPDLVSNQPDNVGDLYESILKCLPELNRSTLTPGAAAAAATPVVVPLNNTYADPVDANNEPSVYCEPNANAESTIRSNKSYVSGVSNASDFSSSSKMANRPLPQTPRPI